MSKYQVIFYSFSSNSRYSYFVKVENELEEQEQKLKGWP